MNTESDGGSRATTASTEAQALSPAAVAQANAPAFEPCDNGGLAPNAPPSLFPPPHSEATTFEVWHVSKRGRGTWHLSIIRDNWDDAYKAYKALIAKGCPCSIIEANRRLRMNHRPSPKRMKSLNAPR